MLDAWTFLDNLIENKYFNFVLVLVLFVLAFAKVIDFLIIIALVMAWLISVLGIARTQIVGNLSPPKKFMFIIISSVIFGILFYYGGKWVKNQNQINTTNLISEPKLQGDYDHAYCYNNRILIVLFSIKNIGRDATTAQDFKLRINGAKSVAPVADPKPFLMDIHIGGKPNNIDMMLFSGEFIQQKTKSLINPGNVVRGWLLWEQTSCPFLPLVNIEFTDVMGHLYSVKVENIQEIPPLPSHEDFGGYPDISYPFIEREIIKQSANISNLPLIHILN